MKFLALALVLVACTPEPESPAPPLVRSVPESIAAEAADEAPPIARKYRAELTRNARVVWGIDAPIALFAGQIAQESAWNANAKSAVGAGGLGQFMASTASDFPDESGAVDVFNPSWALRALTVYDKRLFDRVAYPRECDRAGAMLSQYNGGSRWHDRRRAAAEDKNDFWNSVRVVNPGVTAGNQRENSEYPVRIVSKHQRVYSSWGRMVCE